jgi:hypothetical protein
MFKLKCKTIPVTGRRDLWGCEILKTSHCIESRLTNGGKIISLTCRPPIYSQKYCVCASGTHFCSRLSKRQGLVRPEGLGEVMTIIHLTEWCIRSHSCCDAKSRKGFAWETCAAKGEFLWTCSKVCYAWECAAGRCACEWGPHNGAELSQMSVDICIFHYSKCLAVILTKYDSNIWNIFYCPISNSMVRHRTIRTDEVRGGRRWQ